jgi:hypothetical protein
VHIPQDFVTFFMDFAQIHWNADSQKAGSPEGLPAERIYAMKLKLHSKRKLDLLLNPHNTA